MNYAKLNGKKAFINNKIIVGVDIAKTKHSATIMLPDGRIPCKPLTFFNSGQSFKNLVNSINHMKDKYGVDDVVVAMEATGHYWEPLAHYLENQGIMMVFVSAFVVKKERECMDLSRNKNDSKDSYIIAQTAREGKFSQMVIQKGAYANLRRCASFRNSLLKDFSGSKNRITAIMDIYFPEYSTLFSDLFGKTSMHILCNCPFPEDIRQLGLEELALQIKRASSNRLGKDKAKDIYERALCTIGISEGIESARLELSDLLMELEIKLKQLNRTANDMKKYLAQTGLSEYLLSIPGVGVITASTIVGEIGDFCNYHSAKELIKLAGLNLVENQSGKKGGKTHRISRAGRGLLRKSLYWATVSSLNSNFTIKAYYLRLIDTGLVKMKALVAAMSKLLRIIFALCRKKESFVEEEGSRIMAETLRQKIQERNECKKVKKAA